MPRLKEEDIDPVAIRYATTPLAASPVAERLRADAIDLHEIDGQGLSLAQGVRSVLDILSFEQPNVIVADHVLPAMLASIWTRSAGVPSVMVIRSDDHWYRRLADEFLWGSKNCHMHGVVAVSNELHSHVVGKLPTGMLSMQCPSSVPLPTETAEWKKDEFHIVYMGRFESAQKRIRPLTHRLIEVSRSRPWFRATLYGHGPELDDVLNILDTSDGHRVEYGGCLGIADVYPVMLSAQAMVLLSNYEGLSTTVQEAMACGLPVIIKRMESGFDGVIKHKENAWVLEDDEEIGDAVDALAASKSQWNHMASNARKLAESTFSIKKNVKRWSTFLKRLQNQSMAKPIQVPPLAVIEEALSVHYQNVVNWLEQKDAINQHDAQLMVQHGNTWGPALGRFIRDFEFPIHIRRQVLHHALKRDLIHRDGLERLCREGCIESELAQWLFCQAASVGKIGVEKAMDAICRKNWDWNRRRWLLYRLMEKERLDSEQTRRLAEYLAHEGLSMYVTDSDHQYNCASLLEVGQQLHEAETLFRQLSDRPRDNEFRAGCLYHLGCITRQTGGQSESIACFNECLSLCPQHQASLAALRRMCHR